MTDEEHLSGLMRELAAEFPTLRIVPKARSWLQRALHRALTVVTLGGNRRYLDGYVTTIGYRIYVPTGWDERSAAERYVTLRHERVHLRQYRRYGLIPMALAYLLLPLPVGLAWCRTRLEQEAYAEGLRAMADLRGFEAIRRPELRAYIIGQFTGPAYGWMWPFRRQLERWYDGVTRPLGPC